MTIYMTLRRSPGYILWYEDIYIYIRQKPFDSYRTGNHNNSERIRQQVYSQNSLKGWEVYT